MRYKLRISLFFIIFMAVGLTQADDDRSERVMALSSNMILWVVSHTEYAAPDPPSVEFIDQMALRQRCYPGLDLTHVPQLWGIYDPVTATIYLDDDCRLDDQVSASYLLHEIVHHVQVANDAHLHVKCRGRLEGEAVTLQAQWLKEKGVENPLEVLGIDERTLEIISSCLH
ncbi:DUF6647 family protein [Modicisalibacter xianhensis]|uniref:DUF6647 domain-containing protein n=1 Tax=Modicisalibacter xianhensis TaxID=442341 RepID=A0A1I3APS0_9GAMM|nr:DUF6647 family protein [Halomonas xianhensis]SFH51796.1 hypothetical protein SAMN04487959_10558 [Halomonas xianhensis]